MQNKFATHSAILFKQGTAHVAPPYASEHVITAALQVLQVLRSALGPNSLSKMLVDPFGGIVITNDGARILQEMSLAHPAAKMIAEIAKTQEKLVGDGTTTVAILTGEFLRACLHLIQHQGYHAMALADYLHEALQYCISSLDTFAKQQQQDTNVYLQIVQTTLATKYIGKYLQPLSVIAVNAVMQCTAQFDWLSYFRIVRIAHGNVEDSQVVYNGTVLACKRVHITTSNSIPLENVPCVWIQGDLQHNANQNAMVKRVQVIKSAKDFIQTTNMDSYIQFIKALQHHKVQLLLLTGAIHDACIGLFLQANITVLEHIAIHGNEALSLQDSKFLHSCLGCHSISNWMTETISEQHISVVERLHIQATNKVILQRDPKLSPCTTVILRGPTMDLIKEVQIGFEDAIMICKNARQQELCKIVYGGGACETQWYTLLHNKAQTFADERRQVFIAFAECFLVIPTILLENAGVQSQLHDRLEELKAQHAQGNASFGVDKQGTICDMSTLSVVEPTFLKYSVLQTCSEATSSMLKIDHVVLEQLQQRQVKTGFM